jgi:hypothetical protein
MLIPLIRKYRKGGRDLFDDDLFTKRKEVMTMSNLNVLIEKYVAQMKELETRMADTKHKLEIILEATHLLVEEGLSDEYSSDRSGEDRISKRQVERSSH